MGAIIYIVNFDKRQYIDPACFGESVEPGGYMLGYHASAVALLTCAPGPLIDLGSQWPGAWFGDRVQVVYNERDYNPLGIETGTSENPDRELYPMIWQEFQEYSREALAMICNADEQTADELARRAKDDYVGFLDQGPYIELPSGRAGAWCGDRVHVVYNADEFNPLEIVAATAENPGRTLYAMVKQEFDDLSREAVAIVCNWVDGAAEAIARRARKEAGPPDQNHLLWNLGRIVFNNWSPRLKQALAENYGPAWAQDYERTKANFDHSKKWYEF